MANIVNSTFSGTVVFKSTKYSYTANDDDDCIVGVFTDFGNSTFTYNAAEINVGSAWNQANVLSNLANSTAVAGNIPGSGGSRYIDFNNYLVRPTRVTLFGDANGTFGAPYDFRIYCENTETGESVSDFLSNVVGGSGSHTTWHHIDLQDKVKFNCNRFRFENPETNSVDISRIYIYGEIFRQDGAELSPTEGATTIESLSDSAVDVDTDTEGLLQKQSLLTVEPYKPQRVVTLTMTGTVNQVEGSSAVTFLLDPNGGNRTFNLPQYPQTNQQVRLINLDGAFSITVNEGGGSPTIETLSTANSTLILDAYWDGTQWVVTSL